MCIIKVDRKRQKSSLSAILQIYNSNILPTALRKPRAMQHTVYVSLFHLNTVGSQWTRYTRIFILQYLIDDGKPVGWVQRFDSSLRKAQSRHFPILVHCLSTRAGRACVTGQSESGCRLCERASHFLSRLGRTSRTQTPPNIIIVMLMCHRNANGQCEWTANEQTLGRFMLLSDFYFRLRRVIKYITFTHVRVEVSFIKLVKSPIARGLYAYCITRPQYALTLHSQEWSV